MTPYASALLAPQVTGCQTPRISHYPERVHSAGPAAVELAAMAGLHLDPWEKLVLDQMLGERDVWYHNDVLNTEMRTYAAYEVGLVVSRQNGKGSILEARELAGLFLLGERTILHTAHEHPTAMEGFARLEALISGDPELKKEVARGGIKWSHGSESITLRSGQRILFKTRTKGAARGFTVDCLVFDEAMYLKKEHIGAMQFSVSARPNAQLIYTGSAGDKESEHLGRARSRGIRKSDPRLAYMEWSVDACTEFCEDTCTEHDPVEIKNEHKLSPEELERAKAELVTSYAKSNPGLGYRIQVENIESERRSMDRETFSRERLGVGDWPVEGEAWRIIDEESWQSRYDELSRPEGPFTFSIDTTPDRRHSCIAVAGANGEGAVHVEITSEVTESGNVRLDYRTGTDWVIGRAIQIAKRNRPATFVLDKGGPAGMFVEPLEAAGIKVLTVTAREYAHACGSFAGMVLPHSTGSFIRHTGQPILSAAVANAEKRDLADLWAWDKRNASGDISPLVAVTNAVWGYHQGVYKKKSKPKAAWG